MLLEQLRAFHEVVKQGGFERASEYLHVSQPAISMRIKELEKFLGVELFTRLGRRDHLTEAGRIVGEYAARLMIVLREMEETMDQLKGLQKGQLRCGAATTIAVHMLPGVLVQFKKQFPNIDIKLQVGRTVETERRILADELDVGVITGILADPEKLKIFHFLTDEVVFITPPNHPLARLRRVSLKQIRDIPLILREQRSLTRMIIDESFRAAGIPHHCMMEMGTTEALKRAVAEGLGCSFVSRCSIQTEVKTGILNFSRVVDAPMKREYRVIMHKDKTISGPIKPFLQLLKIKHNSERTGHPPANNAR
jgi:DNA-binding transcriptional LysR family regulator